MEKIKKFLGKIGPGVITGASDDDPSGIVIYSQAGARAGYSLLWTAPFLIPLMINIQEICARIGLVTGHGLIGTMRRHYSTLLLWFIATIVFASNTINIGADLSAMAASTRLLIPVNEQLASVIYGVLIVSLLLFFSYKQITKVLKFLTLSLFAYILAIFATSPNWQDVIVNTIIPQISFNKETLLLLVAILGTTISPYLFFWQSSEEAEDREAKGEIDHRKKIQKVPGAEIKTMREDVTTGMIFSNLIMFFIIATVGSTLFKAGIHEVETAQQAAQALRPLAGDASFILFTLGIVGTGLLAIPVLAGSAAYAVSEVLGWEEGLTSSPLKSKLFYFVITLSTTMGVSFTLFGISPFKALFLTGVIYGILAPILILIILHIANRKDIMGNYTNGIVSNVLGTATFLIMSLAAFGALVL